MEEKFTKLNLNGVDKFVSAIYDGSGNEIVSTYETKADSTNKLEAINLSINTTNTNLSALDARVVETEKYKTTIDSNTSNIQKNEAAIATLQAADVKFGEDLGALVIQVGEDETLINTNTKDISTLYKSTSQLQTGLTTLDALVNDGATGLNKLNEKVDKNIADIAKVNLDVADLLANKSSNNSAIIALQTLQQTNINNISKNTSDIEAINTALAPINQFVESTTATLAQLQPQVESNQQSIIATRGDIEAHTTDIEKLKEVTNLLPSKVDSLGEAFNALDGKVAGFETSLGNMVSKETYEALLARVVVLEEAMAKYHPEEQPTE